MRKAGRADLNPIKKGVSPHFREGRVMSLPDFLKVDLKRIKPFHDTLRYGHAVGRVRVMELQMLSSHRLERLVEADFEGALNILDEIAMGDYLAEAETVKDVDAGLVAFLRDVYASLDEALPPDSFLMDFFLCRYDFHNLKALLKAGEKGEEAKSLLEGLGQLDIEVLREGLNDIASLPSPYRETAEECMRGEVTPQEMDTIVDRHYLAYRLLLAGREGSPFVIDFARASIDLANLKLLLRGRNLGKEREFLEAGLVAGGFITTGGLLDLYGDPPEVMVKKLESNVYFSRLVEVLEDAGETFRLTDFDRKSDDYLMDLVKGTKRISLGPEPIFAYLRARENEALMVRMILIAKLHNIAPASIENMLRNVYVE